jgi:hypothetical protein
LRILERVVSGDDRPIDGKFRHIKKPIQFVRSRLTVFADLGVCSRSLDLPARDPASAPRLDGPLQLCSLRPVLWPH